MTSQLLSQDEAISILSSSSCARAPHTEISTFIIHQVHMENLPQASKWFNILLARVPSDPGILSRMGHIANKEEDDSQAYFYHKERSVQSYPSVIMFICMFILYVCRAMRVCGTLGGHTGVACTETSFTTRAVELTRE